jgi:hypothetical protein
MKIKPGYRTTEHALAWAVVVLGVVAVFRCRGAVEQWVAMVGPAVASAAYSQSRGRAKAAGPFVVASGGGIGAASLAEQLGELFRGRIVN